MIKFEFILHSELKDDQVLSICELKAQHWHYDLESQKIWLAENFSTNDVHLLLYFNEKPVGYLSLVHLNIANILVSDLEIFGLGSVCVSIESKGKNFGLLLMNLVNFYLQSHRGFGILLCKTNLVPFYKKTGWIEYHGEVTIKSEPFENCLMTTSAIESKKIDLPISF